jgi:hypothetical protein
MRIEAQGKADSALIEAQGRAKARAALGISPEQYTQLEIAKMKTDAIKQSPNLMIVPENAFLDARSLLDGQKPDRRQPRP